MLFPHLNKLILLAKFRERGISRWSMGFFRRQPHGTNADTIGSLRYWNNDRSYDDRRSFVGFLWILVNKLIAKGLISGVGPI